MHLDYETYSEADLRKVGLANYARHPSTRVILAAWTDAGGNLKQYDERNPESNSIEELRRDLEIADEINAWNATFEAEITRHVLGLDIPVERWNCTMAHALYRSLPAGLDAACEALGLEGKTPYASRLIRLFCTPKTGRGDPVENPGDWERFRQYNENDIVLEAAVKELLEQLNLDFPKHERRIFWVSQKINLRGIPVDVERAELGASMFERLCQEANDEIRSIAPQIDNPNSPIQIKDWVGQRLGRKIETLEAKAMNELLAQELPPDVRRVLLLRAGAAMTAPKKYAVAVQNGVKQGDQVHLLHVLQYSGAGRTHRWSGRGIQPQNFRRGLDKDEAIQDAWEALGTRDTEFVRAMYPGPFKLVADLVRSIIRPKGSKVVVADFSSIEVVMLYWASGDKEKMQRFAQGLDPYKDFASSFFGVPYDAVTKQQRTFAKPPVLGGGYGLGPDTLIEYAAGMGVKMKRDEAMRAVQTYRQEHPMVCELWRGLETAMRRAIETGKAYRYRCFVFEPRPRSVVCILPSGSEITYFDARVEETKRIRRPPAPIKDPEEARRYEEDPENWYWTHQIVYKGLDQYSKHWGDVYTWGGKLVENIVQSISRDVLAEALLNAVEKGLDVFLHVHDEIVAAGSEKDLESLLQVMSKAPSWCPDAPIRASGFVAPAYRKD